MKRRDFITLLVGAAVAWPLAARAQQTDRIRRIGVFMNLAADDPEGQARNMAFVQALQQLGWTDGPTHASILAGAQTPTALANTRQNWWRWPPTSSWPLRAQPRARCNR